MNISTTLRTPTPWLIAATVAALLSASAAPALADGPADCTGLPDLTECISDGFECTHDICQGGTCQHTTKATASPCTDDGNECTFDFCIGNTCEHFHKPNETPCTDDSNECTFDFCIGAVCEHFLKPTETPCTDDGNACTMDFCVGPVCEHFITGLNSACDDDQNDCTLDICDGGGNCMHPGPATCLSDCAVDPDFTACDDDGNDCTVDYCQGGICTHVNLPLSAPCSDDGNDCTADRCNGSGLCTHPPRTFTTPCADDGSECTNDRCDGSGICQHTSLQLGTPCADDGFDCTTDRCNGTPTCAHVPLAIGGGCNDDADDCTFDFCGPTPGVCDHQAIATCTTPLQDSAQVKCLTGLNGAGIKLSAAQGKHNAGCIKAAVKGTEPAPQACLTTDTKGKLAKAASKVTDTFNNKCTTSPDFGAAEPAPILASADDERRALIADLFGASLTGVVTADNSGNTGKCQAGVNKATEKFVDAELKSFVKCKKTGLKTDIISRLGLDACLEAVATAAGDPISSIGKALAKVGSARTKSCGGVSIASAFPGKCKALGNTTDFDDCAARLAQCRACRIIVAIDAPFMNCDIFDDGIGNLSCPTN